VREAAGRDRNKVEFRAAKMVTEVEIFNRVCPVMGGLIIFLPSIPEWDEKKPFHSKAFSYPATLDALNFPN